MTWGWRHVGRADYPVVVDVLLSYASGLVLTGCSYAMLGRVATEESRAAYLSATAEIVAELVSVRLRGKRAEAGGR